MKAASLKHSGSADAAARAETMPSRSRRRLALGVGLAAVVLYAAGFVAFAANLPDRGAAPAGSADAIVALTGDGDRLTPAVTLLEQGNGQATFDHRRQPAHHQAAFEISAAWRRRLRLLRRSRLRRRGHPRQRGRSRALGIGARVPQRDCGDRRLSHAAQPGGIFRRHAGCETHSLSGGGLRARRDEVADTGWAARGICQISRKSGAGLR